MILISIGNFQLFRQLKNGAEDDVDGVNPRFAQAGGRTAKSTGLRRNLSISIVARITQERIVLDGLPNARNFKINGLIKKVRASAHLVPTLLISCRPSL